MLKTSIREENEEDEDEDDKKDTGVRDSINRTDD
jgi:hypothetical protein